MSWIARRLKQTQPKARSSAAGARWVVRSSEAKPLRFSEATVDRLKHEAAQRERQPAAG